MEDTFVLKIQLGDDAMQNAEDVASALRATATKLEVNYDELSTSAYGYVIDANGNNVGSWEIQ